MRDERYRANHRGGLLSLREHRLLVLWAAACAERVLPLFHHLDDDRPLQATEVARAWAGGKMTVGEARTAAFAAHAAARETAGAAQFAARAAGHAAATAHMADHATRSARYALKAVKAAGDEAAEKRWQEKQLPEAIRALVLSTVD